MAARNNHEANKKGQPSLGGVSNGPIKFESALIIWPLLELLAKIR